MPLITCYEQNQIHITQSVIWDSIATLAKHVPDELLIITANNNYRESLIHLLIQREKCDYFPTIQSFDDWINQLLNIEPFSYYLCQHHLLTLIESNELADSLAFLKQDDMLKSLLNFFLFLLVHDYSFTDSKQLFPDYLTTIEQETKQLFALFKQSISEQPSFYSVLKKCQLIQTKKQLIAKQLNNKTILFIGFTNLTKTQRYIMQRLVPMTAHSAFYTSKDSLIQQWLETEFNDVQLIPQQVDITPSKLPLYHFDSIQSECRWVLKHSLLQLNDTTAQHIQIVIPKDRHYSKKIYDLAKECDVSLVNNSPVRFQDTSLFETIKNIVHFIQYPEEISSLECLFSSPLISDFKHNDIDYPIDLELILQVIRKESVGIGFHAIKQAFDYNLSTLNEKVNYSKDDDQSKRLAQRLAEQWLIIETLYTYLGLFKQQRSLTGWLDCLLDLFEHFNIQIQISSLADQDNLINQQAFHHFIQQLPRFIAYIEPDCDVNTRLITKRLILFLEQLTIEQNEPSQLPIHVHTLQEAVFFPADITYVLGFNDSSWPYSISENIFLKQISSAAFIDTYDDDNAYQQLLMAQLCSQNVIFTSPKEFMGKQTEPSRFEFNLTIEQIDPAPQIDFATKIEYLNQPLSIIDSMLLDVEYFQTKYQSIGETSRSLISNQTLLTDLSEKIIEHPFSATRLDTYQRCPRQFYFRYILGIEPAQELSEGISAAQWGLLIHDMMYIFNKKGQYNNKSQLISAAEIAFSKVPQQSFYWQQKRELLFGSGEEEGLIDSIFNMIQDQPYRLQSGQFEMDFNWTLKQTSYQLKGKVDALFYTANNDAILIDYKTSRQLTTSIDFEEYRSLQLPIYGLSIMKQLGQLPVGSLLFQINSPSHTDIKVIACTKDAKKDTFELKRKRPFIYETDYFSRLEDRLIHLITLLESGFISTDYHPLLANTYTKRAQSCRVCAYKLHCQFKERFDAVY